MARNPRPTTTASGALVGRPRKNPPPDIGPRIQALVAGGHSLVGVASEFGVDVKTFKEWLKEQPDLKEAFDRGQEQERHVLHDRVHKLAMNDDDPKVALNAAMFLLKTRHGYTEGAPADNGNRPAVTIVMPGARPLSEFMVLENAATDTPTQRLSNTTLGTTRGG